MKSIQIQVWGRGFGPAAELLLGVCNRRAGSQAGRKLRSATAVPMTSPAALGL